MTGSSSTEPPMLALTIEAAPGGGAKDTLRNIRTTGEFVVNTVSVARARQMDLTGVRSSPSTSPRSC
jgi:flavin reductase (DIM6/NTAB) family NADH-FMN oxidoreductase RutF